MALTCAEPRLAPLGNTFQVWDERPPERKRSHSHSGYTPHHLRTLQDAPEPGRARRAASPGAAPCASEASEGSTAAPGSQASEAPSTAGDGAAEPWPDTDSDGEEGYEWSPCSRRTRGPEPAACAGAEAGGEGWPRHAACGALPPLQVLATTPTGRAVSAPAAAAPSALAPPPAVLPWPWQAGAASCAAAPPPGAAGQSPAQALAPPWPAMRAPLAGVPALQGPRWLGGQAPPMPVGSIAARAAGLLPPWRPAGAQGLPVEAAGQSCSLLAAGSALAAPQARAASLESAMQAAESALAALEAAEEAAAREAAADASEGLVARAAPQAPRTLPAGVTTLMLGSLPREVTQRKLLDDVSRSGFVGKFNFCYMPRDFASGHNLGHAFLNFTSHAAAAEFHQAWHGRPRCAGRAASPCGLDVSVAALQGLAANAAKWDSPRTRRVRNPDFRPFVLEGGAAGCPCRETPRGTEAA